mgnify:FL=1
MKYLVRDIVTELGERPTDLRRPIATHLKIRENSFRYAIERRRLVLIRGRLMWDYDIEVDTLEFVRNTSVRLKKEATPYVISRQNHEGNPIVIGAGIAGLVAATILAKNGAKPIVLEQGEPLSEREKSLRFAEERSGGENGSVYAFGEGGRIAALGGFIEIKDSDDPTRCALDILVEAGLPTERRNEGFTHLSPKEARGIAHRLVEMILSLGGEVIFGAKLLSVERFLGRPKGVTYSKNGSKKTIKGSQILFATGNSDASIQAMYDARVGLESAPSILSMFIETDGHEYEQTYFGRGRLASLPPLFMSERMTTKEGRKITFNFGWTHASLLNVASIPNAIDVGLRPNTEARLTNAIARLDVKLTYEEAEQLSLEKTTAFGGRLLTSLSRRDKPGAIPIEPVQDFLSKKDPLVMSKVRPSIKGPFVLGNLYALLPLNIGEAFREGLKLAGQRHPIWIKEGNTLVGFSSGRGVACAPSLEAKPPKGIYVAKPVKRPGDVLSAALSGLFAAVNCLSEA